MSDLDGNPEDRFSQVGAHMVSKPCTNSHLSTVTEFKEMAINKKMLHPLLSRIMRKPGIRVFLIRSDTK